MIVPGVAAITTIYDEMLSPEYFRYSCWSLAVLLLILAARLAVKRVRAAGRVEDRPARSLREIWEEEQRAEAAAKADAPVAEAPPAPAGKDPEEIEKDSTGTL